MEGCRNFRLDWRLRLQQELPGFHFGKQRQIARNSFDSAIVKLNLISYQSSVLNFSEHGFSVLVASGTTLAPRPTTIALGKFDGVHLGHQKVIQPILQSASTTGLQSTVVTFHPHPQEFFTGQPRALLTPLEEKVQQLRSLGVEQLVLLPFDKELAALSPEDFVSKILVEQLQSRRISVGQDFCFGKQRTGTAEDLQLIAAKYNIPVNIVSLQTYTENATTETQPSEDIPISTSLIRQMLESGDIYLANKLLGRPYTLTGVVQLGQQLGRTLGFPTANLLLPKDKFLPKFGVYAVRVSIFDTSVDAGDTLQVKQLGVMNIGHRPTVNGNNCAPEVHLFDWSGDLYGKKLVVELVKFLRQEQKFPSLTALKTQIQLDSVEAKSVLLVT